MQPRAQQWQVPAKGGGFSLIELMIVVVIVGILAAVALPAYQQYTADTRRSDGREVLLNTAQRLERCYTTHGSYADNGCSLVDGGSLDGDIDSQNEFYTITEAASTISANEFELVAVPQGGHAGDACGNLSLEETGQKGTSGSLGVDECW